MTIFIKNMMIIFIIFISVPCFAQTHPFFNSHELRVSVGLLTLDHCDLGNCLTPYYNSDFPEFTSHDYVKLSNSHYHNSKFFDNTPASISASYIYNINKLLSFGAFFTYMSNSHLVKNRVTGEILQEGDNYNFSITPSLRILYMRRELINLYGQLGFGLGINRYNFANYGVDYDPDNWKYDPFLSWHVTLFGISVGRKVFGFFEYGVGNAGGLCNVGIGYRFNAKK